MNAKQRRKRKRARERRFYERAVDFLTNCPDIGAIAKRLSERLADRPLPAEYRIPVRVPSRRSP